jgi:hypothetical protein
MSATTALVQIDALADAVLQGQPYRWARVAGLFSSAHAAELVATFPDAPYQTIVGADGEKGYEYEARLLVAMGDDRPAHRGDLSPAWELLARDLVSASYREAMSGLTGIELGAAPVEVNAFHYGARGWLGPHADLVDKIATHVLYFNQSWQPQLGGCLRILRSADINDVAVELSPTVGHSVVIVRSDGSYHAVTPVSARAQEGRRSVTVTFYRPGSVSTLWPPGLKPSLHQVRFVA